jgi:hypothetical protein
MLELPVAPMLDAPVLDEPMLEEPILDEPVRDDESIPLHALSAATQMAESISFFIYLSFEQLSDAALSGRRNVCHNRNE